MIPVAVEIPVAPPKLDPRTVSATTPGDSSSDIALDATSTLVAADTVEVGITVAAVVAAVACALE